MANEIQKAPTPSNLLEIAIQKGVDMAQLKELMDLQERWEKKEAKKSFLDALSQFQSAVPELKKSRTAKINSQKGFFSYKFADLASITKAINPFLHKFGLSYRWDFEENNEKLKVHCRVSHRDGHSETTSMEAGKDNTGAKNDIQQKGSTQTYLQRYTLIGALGLSTAEEDIDGHGSLDNSKQMSDEEIMQQWQDLVDGTKNQIELTSLYLKNKKSVDAQPKVQAMFKAKEAEHKKLVKGVVQMK